MPLTDLDWLRHLLEDQPTKEIEAVTGNGTDREFTVSNPPISVGTLAVTLNGSPQTPGTHYTQPDTATVLFATPPPDDAHVIFTYSRQLFQTLELQAYLDTGAIDWPVTQPDAQIGRVYKAAVLAIDGLLTGLATALRSGAGAEEIDMPSVFDRLSQRRSQLASMLAGEGGRPKVFAPLDPVLPP